ncbi:hypothetical protein CROQUDRAFT_663015 [Cronartium quercuum f. sp. fusiforme G11]|uniref:Ergosterol biosynthetic protein 28 n=1 Tax=Cronartium quercuum f. sp. fusiforme G11 TaxID=708437 RepID=A0A9P6T7L6_9BASI|nr:hypothetical protein CROQUDRAFT_663015 [Cronartium quercuum f. sp. fusiforme G11]
MSPKFAIPILSGLPEHDGLLPKWMAFIAVVSVFNTIQNFLTLSLTRRIYSGQPQLVNALQSRTFGIWTLTSGLIRLYTAYNIHNQALYQLAICSYTIALVHFISELLIFKSSRLGSGLISPLMVASTSLVWMFRQYDFYVG